MKNVINATNTYIPSKIISSTFPVPSLKNFARELCPSISWLTIKYPFIALDAIGININTLISKFLFKTVNIPANSTSSNKTTEITEKAPTVESFKILSFVSLSLLERSASETSIKPSRCKNPVKIYGTVKIRAAISIIGTFSLLNTKKLKYQSAPIINPIKG